MQNFTKVFNSFNAMKKHSLLLGKVFPESYRHILTLLARIATLLDGDSLEIGAPHIL